MTTPQALADEAKRKLTAALNAAGGHIAGFRLMTEIVGLLDSLAALAATPPQTSVQGASPSGTALSAAIPNADLLGLVREADDLLGVARGAAMKLGLRDRGSDCRLPHEVRMFALDFSNEGRDGPGALQVRGTGRFLAWRRKARGIEADARRAGAESPVPPGTRPDPQSQPVAAHPESITEMMDTIIETSEGIGRAGPATDLVLTLRQKRREAYHRITRACGVVVFDGPDAFAEADAATARLDAEIEAAGGLEAWRAAASKEVAAQQPFGWYYCTNLFSGAHDEGFTRDRGRAERLQSGGTYNITPLVAAQQPLTADKLEKLWQMAAMNVDIHTFHARAMAFARAIERAHGIGVKA